MEPIVNPVTLVLLACMAGAIWLWSARRGRGATAEEELRLVCQGNESQAERLIEGEIARAPGLSRKEAARRAVERYRRDNR